MLSPTAVRPGLVSPILPHQPATFWRDTARDCPTSRKVVTSANRVSWELYARHQDIYRPNDKITLTCDIPGAAQTRPSHSRNQSCCEDQAPAIMLEFRVQVLHRRVAGQKRNNDYGVIGRQKVAFDNDHRNTIVHRDIETCQGVHEDRVGDAMMSASGCP